MKGISKKIGAFALLSALALMSGCSSPNYGGSVNTYFGNFDGTYSATNSTSITGTMSATIDSSGNFSASLIPTNSTTVAATFSGTVTSAVPGISSGTMTLTGNNANYTYSGDFNENATGTGFNAVLNCNTVPASVFTLVLIQSGPQNGKAKPK